MVFILWARAHTSIEHTYRPAEHHYYAHASRRGSVQLGAEAVTARLRSGGLAASAEHQRRGVTSAANF